MGYKASMRYCIYTTLYYIDGVICNYVFLSIEISIYRNFCVQMALQIVDSRFLNFHIITNTNLT